MPLSFLLRPLFRVIVLSYIALQFLYTYWLKEQVLLDVFALAASFVLRAMAGAGVIAAPISPWLYVCTILGSLCLGFAKRRHELMLLEAGAAMVSLGGARRLITRPQADVFPAPFGEASAEKRALQT